MHAAINIFISPKVIQDETRNVWYHRLLHPLRSYVFLVLALYHETSFSWLPLGELLKISQRLF